MAHDKNGTTFAYKVVNNSSSGGAIYGIGILGALVYYIQTSTSFWDGVLGIIFSIFWPAVILYEVLKMLNL